MAFIRASSQYRWPNGVIPFAFDNDTIPAGDPIRNTVMNAIAFWTVETPLVFVPRTTEPDYILVKRVANKERCSMFVGRKGGAQDLECAGSPEDARVAHELGHAIGFFHEHQRTDRDAMVGVSYAAIRDESHNYRRIDDELMSGPYEFSSLMHYLVSTAAADRRPLTKIHPDPALPPVYAATAANSPGDRRAVQFMYGIIPERSPIAALTKGNDHMELWVVDQDGVVRGAPFFNGAWQTWYFLFGRQFPQRGHLAALRRDSGHMEVWGVGTDGLLHGVWFNGASWEKWYTLGAPAIAGLPPGTPPLPPGAPLAAWSRNEDHMEVWVIGNDGLLHGVWFDGSKWRGWYSLGGRSFPPNAHLAVLGRDDDHMEVWGVGTDGVLHGAYFVGGWQPWYSLPGPTLVPGAGIACVSRSDDHMEVWSIGGDDRLHGVWWNGQNWQGWYTLFGASFPPGAPLAALSRDTDHMEVWAVDDTDHLRGIYFVGGWQSWYSLGPPDVPRATPLAALSRASGLMEVWCVAPVNPAGTIGVQGVQGVWFDGAWHPFYRVV